MALRIRGILYNAIRYLFCLMRALFPVCFVCAQLCRAQAPSLTSVPRWCPQSLRRPLPVSQRNQLLRWGYRKKGGGASPWVRSQLWECMGGPLWPGQVRTPRPLLFSFEALPPADSSGGGMEADHSQYPFPFSLLFLRKNLLYKKEWDGHALPFPHQLSHCMMTPFMTPHLSTCRGSSREVSGKRLKGMNFTVCIL